MTKTHKRGPAKDPTTQATSPWRKRIAIAGGVIAVVLLNVVILTGTLNEPTGGVPEGTKEIAVGAPAHVEGNLYDDHEVPAGGEHSPIWANCGFYSEPIDAENVVHSLEHGAVWITYTADLPVDDLDLLRRQARPAEKVLASPVEDQQSPITVTAWGYQLDLDSAQDPRLEQFVSEFAGSLDAPEPGGACSGGVGAPA
ncbi:MAG: DUF3105 domain-containing protein [Acidobacteria bacterium]|nr:MAG: DUF3105 domain-containing protein [Acidobacteriota bacterium]